MSWLKNLWRDEAGSVLTAEAVLLGTMGTLGAMAGLNMASNAVNEELKDVARALRHLDQSYKFAGFAGCRAQTAGAQFQQEDLQKSLRRLDQQSSDRPSSETTQEIERLQELREEFRREADRQRERAEQEERSHRKSHNSHN